MTVTENPFLSGNLAPVHEEITSHDLRVTGTLPTELTGRYLRNGPNPVAPVDPERYHWFTGTGMVHGIRLDEGRASWYRNRWVRTDEVARVLGEDAPPSDWPDDHRPFSANTNVVGHAGRTYAIVEAGSPPIELSDELDTVRISNLDGTLPRAFSAHPKRDPLTGELHVMTYWWGWGNRVQYLVVGTDGRVRRTVDVDLPGGPMIHDTSITENFVMVFDLPVLFNLEAAMGGAGLPYFWDPQYTPRIGLLRRDDSGASGSSRSSGDPDVTWFEIDPCYVFHPMNSFETVNAAGEPVVVLDAVRHPKMFDRERRGPSEGPPRLDRWTLNLATGRTSNETLDDHPQEFPRVDERLVGREYRYGYTAGIGSGFRQDAISRIDTVTGRVERRTDTERYGYGEPVMVPRHAEAAEDDGWVLALRHDWDTDLSELSVFDAGDVTGDPVAVVHLPARVPNGFHGNWIPDHA
ncbi:MAG: carotenoid oxygenase family protein [Ilumatobacteraceae bacterium]